MQLPERDLLERPISVAEFDQAAAAIAGTLTPTPTIQWPLLAERCGSDVFVKHENHLPTGAFKVRGGVWLMQHLASAQPPPNGVIAATRGNHGQSIAFAARAAGIPAVIVVPHGNNNDKNRAMRAFGAELIESGRDFDDALAAAAELASTRKLLALPSFHWRLVEGVGTYAMELFRQAAELDVVFAPIGLGSGICGLIAARDALGLSTEIVGVVSAEADAYAQSFEQGQVVSTASADTLADGLAVRSPAAGALAYMRHGLSRIVRVSDAAILSAIRSYFEDTHNLSEGAGAAPLAALMNERSHWQGRRVGVILSGGNVDALTLKRALETGNERV